MRRHPRGGDGLSDARPVSPRRRRALAGKPARRARGGAERGANGGGRRGAGGASVETADARLGDPGYYLIAKGRPRLERELGFRLPGRQWLRRAWIRAATPLYLAAIVLSTLAILAVPAALTALAGVRASWVVLLALLGLAPASDLAIALVHRFVTRLLGPRRLPKLELAGGVPADLRTLVAIPMLLTDESEIDDVVQTAGGALPRQHRSRAAVRAPVGLARRDRRRAFPRTPRSSSSARAAIRQLNDRHGPAAGGGDRFWLLHRRRLWNEREGVWMGWERKRGKLRELNRLLRGATDTSFLPPDPGAPPAPAGHSLRDHARRRLPPAAGGGAPAGRNDRPPAEPSRLRSGGRPGRGRARHPAASRDPHAARDGLGHALPARLLGTPRHRPLCLRGVRRVPGPLRRGDLHGQGHLRRGRVRAGARRPGAGEHAALPRSLRGALRPGRFRVGRRALRRVPGPLRGGGLAPAPVGPRRLAAAALDPRDGPGSAGRARRPTRSR